MTVGARVAALPMYDDPGVARANDALWRRVAAALRERGIDAPAELTRGSELMRLWRDPGLIFAQTCGYPLMTALRDDVVVLATPEYLFAGCNGADHRSFIIRAAGDPRRTLAEFHGAVAAINASDSNTGMNLFRATIAPIAGKAPFFSKVATTGSHAASLEAVAAGRADLAAIDCVTFGLLARLRPEVVERVAIVVESPPSPCLPFVASARLPEATVVAVREALFAALADPLLAESRAALGLKGARVLPAHAYDRVLALEREAQAQSYPTLA